MDKREALQAVKEAKRRYLLWAGRVEAMLEGFGDEEVHEHPVVFQRWQSQMGKVLHHFEEFKALETAHLQAHDLFHEIHTLLSGQSAKGWAQRLLSFGGQRSEPGASPQDLLAGFKQQAALVLDHLNRLERRLLVIRDAEWEARQNGTWGRPVRRELDPADWAVITLH
ncbi:MAG: hypothetical protein COX57_11655 [Alphaproteobacteria bacterium CG_4_10_14_0_2_um_filter_63_37]|nr:MAG: hypothetical protein AUJ55_09305 [Proteobacteria bacterium CG1_02_64_396]PJA23831.1 MAG: hypothetical protein COX57_11655 [Alphaproteobacteria bacterium CG_4_10_14_0_2_um_filter_63_37]